MKENNNLHIGIDVGSTTVKLAILDEANDVKFAVYRRHHADVRATIVEVLEEAAVDFGPERMTIAITGSGGLLLAQWLGIEFVQEVIASKTAVETFIPKTDVAIELGGEDAKIIYFDQGIEQRMNGTCAGGTGAFIDQMAALLNTDAGGLNELAREATTIYPIASRCGVFAKTDVQPLLNEGARKEDIAASIFQSVVTQTISGLACGRPIRGHVAFLGGPLQYLPELRKRFYETLELDDEHIIVPENAHLFVASGCAIAGAASETVKAELLSDVLDRLKNLGDIQGSEVVRLPPLFADEDEYVRFRQRHDGECVRRGELMDYEGTAYLGIDAGSTTFKAALIGEDGALLWSHYASNKGDVLGCARAALTNLYNDMPVNADTGEPLVRIGHATVTGYGEHLLLEALRVDSGEIETVAHLRGAQEMLPGVEFILDIGGQDMKCFKIRNGAVDSIMLNEACSSGCGSFIETFAKALGYTIADFAKLGLLAKHPVNLGSRCTVFMNSSVKQAQKDGASVEDISAGLSISIVKNAVYKVIRAANADDLGQHIVVQGGTFHNDAVLRAFEQELGRNVTRPTISGIMGAFGAALYARDLHLEKSALLSEEALQSFSHTAKPTTCNLCTNHCSLTVNTFDGGRRFISGNRCSRPLGKAKVENPDLMAYKYKKLRALQGKGNGSGVRGRMGIPFGLNMYENLPFWFEFFTRLNFEVVLSPESSRKLYLKGQHTIPSDTVCYPAKLLHGHVEALVEEGVDAIWYPCMSYNNDEGIGDNHYNCPVVAYYPELLAANVPLLKQTKFLNPYVGLWRHKDFEKRIAQLMEEHFSIPRRETAAAAKAAYAAYDAYVHDVRETGMKYIRHARDHHMPILVACGRPYHIDPEINHGINDLITSFGFVLVTEDALSYLEGYAPRKVLNQWTFQSRMYNAARYVCTQPDMQVVQLVSFGCGTDAITTDELRDILEKGGKLYTQLKIDDISNLGAVKIRIRSLMAAMEARQAQDARG